MRRRPKHMPAPTGCSLPLEDLERAFIIGVKTTFAELRRLSRGTSGSQELGNGSPLDFIRPERATTGAKTEASVWVEWLRDQELKVESIPQDKALVLDLPEGDDMLFNETTRTLHVRKGDKVDVYFLRGRALPVFLTLIFAHRGNIVSYADIAARLRGFENVKGRQRARRVYQYMTRLRKQLGEDLANRIFADADEEKYRINKRGWNHGWVRYTKDADSSQFLRLAGNPSENQ